MFGSRRRRLGFLTAAGLWASCAGLFPSAPRLPTYSKGLTLGSGKEWRFKLLVIDFDRDGHLDLVATARLVEPGLHMWLGDGKGSFAPVTPTWTDIGYGALATGDINGDGFPDIVVASHFGGVQTLLSNGRGGGVTEKRLRREKGPGGAHRAEGSRGGALGLVVVGVR